MREEEKHDMTTEVFNKINSGECPHYPSARTKPELASLMKRNVNAWAIGADLPPGCAFSFFVYSESVAFLGVWPGANGKDVEVRREYPTVERGIDEFVFDRRPLFDVLKGVRFWPFDIPVPI